MSRTLLITSLFTLMIASAAATYAQKTASPPRSAREETPAVQQKTELPASTVTAVIVKSWGNNPVWADLDANWSNYGTTPVSIDYTTLISGDFTYTDLVNSGADVVILSDPAGGLQQYSSAEVAALAKYAKGGHSLLGTYLTFEYDNSEGETYDNRALAPLWGLSSTLTYDYVSISNQFTKVVSKACLFNKISGSTWMSNGYPYSQVPSSGTWSGNLDTAKAAADSDDYVGVITGHRAKAYTAIYVSNMPEYQTTGGDDEQLLYNAITCYATNE
jgi:hypothetical protein